MRRAFGLTLDNAFLRRLTSSEPHRKRKIEIFLK
jgi:hypothetical protein